MTETEVGVVTHYFNHLGVAAVRMTSGELAVGDKVHIKGHTSDFLSPVESIQNEHLEVGAAKAGDSIGIRIEGHAREHDKVFKVAS